MVKNYKSVVKAEMFDGSIEVVKKYDIEVSSNHFGAKTYFIQTNRGKVQLFSDVWIVTELNGDIHILSNDEFNKNYEEISNDK